MIEIKHKRTGEILHIVSANTLIGADLRNVNLIKANLNSVDLSYALLSGAKLREANLRNAILVGTNLSNADLSYAELIKANLINAKLTEADLVGTNLSGANLTKADLIEANLSNANLSNANLSGANLSDAELSNTDISNADLSDADLSFARIDCDFFDVNLHNAQIGYTKFRGCQNLHQAKGLESIRHSGPSTLEALILRESADHLPDVFLRGIGYTSEEIYAFRGINPNQLRTSGQPTRSSDEKINISATSDVDRPIQYYSCFISYSHKDEAFAKRLHGRLVQENIRVWYAPEDMKSGQKLHEQIDNAIRIHDRLLLVISEESMRSEWVMTEIRKARKAEIKDKTRKLFPVSVTDWHKIQDWECFDADIGKDLAVEVREYFVPDFSRWKDYDSFEEAFGKLLISFQSDD